MSPVMFISLVGVIIYCDVRLQTRGSRHGAEGDRYKLQVCSHPPYGKLNCLDFIPHSQPGVSTPGWIEYISADSSGLPEGLRLGAVLGPGPGFVCAGAARQRAVRGVVTSHVT